MSTSTSEVDSMEPKALVSSSEKTPVDTKTGLSTIGKDPIGDDLLSTLHQCGDGILFTLGSSTTPFFGKVLSKGNNLQISKSWHSSEAFLSLGKMGPKIVRRMEQSVERLTESDLPDGAKRAAIALLKIYEVMSQDKMRRFSHQLYVVNLSTNEFFGEVISFQIKKNAVFKYLDCVGLFYDFANRVEERIRERKQLMAEEEEFLERHMQ